MTTAAPTIHPIAGLCTTCDTTGRRGYCAKGACYCGHPTCHGYASYRELRPSTTPITPTRTGTTWADRTHTTWIDNL